MVMNNQDQDDELRQFELYGEIGALYTCSAQDCMTFASYDELDCSDYSSVSVFLVYSVASIASNKTPGSPDIAKNFRQLVCAGNVSLHILTEANLNSCSSGGHERCFGSNDGTRSQSGKSLRLELSRDCEHDGSEHGSDL